MLNVNVDTVTSIPLKSEFIRRNGFITYCAASGEFKLFARNGADDSGRDIYILLGGATDIVPDVEIEVHWKHCWDMYIKSKSPKLGEETR